MGELQTQNKRANYNIANPLYSDVKYYRMEDVVAYLGISVKHFKLKYITNALDIDEHDRLEIAKVGAKYFVSKKSFDRFLKSHIIINSK